jgi:hypothetical protein
VVKLPFAADRCQGRAGVRTSARRAAHADLDRHSTSPPPPLSVRGDASGCEDLEEVLPRRPPSCSATESSTCCLAGGPTPSPVASGVFFFCVACQWAVEPPPGVHVGLCSREVEL